MDDVARALAENHPLPLLAQASTLLAVVDPRTRDPFELPGEGKRGLDREELVGSLLDVRQRETSALLAAFAAMTPDQVLATRIRRELARRDDALPAWLMGLEGTEAYRAVEMGHVLGDGDNVMVAICVPPGHEMTAVVYVDHNLGTVVKDAFVVPEPIDDLVEFMREKSGHDPDTTWAALDPADARARITDAIEVGAMTVPRFETDTWPACRALVEWAAALLPAGGHGYARPEWDDAEQQALADRFAASSFADGLDDDQLDAVDHLLWFGTAYGPGDPMRWSPVAVEIVLADWIPRKIVTNVSYLAKIPGVLRAFIRFCHAERGVRPGLTAETLAAVDRFEPGYQRTIRSARPQGAEALLVALGQLDPDGPWLAPEEDPVDYREVMFDVLRRSVGGADVLDRLDDAPLPDEPFAWDGVPDDVRPTVADVLVQCDRCCDELLDVEYRTACRRFLAAVACRDASVFRRRARTDTTAAAVCWVVGKANDLFVVYGGGMLVKDLMAHFGHSQGGPSQRGSALLRAGGFATGRYGEIALGSPAYLVSSRRRTILKRRDVYRARS